MYSLHLCSSLSVMGASPTVLFPSYGQVHNIGATNVPALRISYNVPLHIRLFCVANSLGRFLGITQKAYTNPEDAEEFVPIRNGHHYVDTYCDRLCSMYTEPKMHHLRFERWQASDICTYKGHGTIEHEYLIATLHDADNRVIYLRLERGIQVSSTHPTHAHAVERSGLSAASGTFADSGRQTVNEAALFAFSAFKEDRQPVVHLRFDNGNYIPLPRLVVLASTIDEYLKTRQSAHHNCYWFCHVISEALKKRFNHKILSGDGLQQGRGHNILLYQGVDIDEVLDLYDTSWNKFVQKVCSVLYVIISNVHIIID